jgi:hypothetical protein
LQNKLYRFRNCHEESRDIRVRNQDRTSLLNLLLEDGDDTPTASEHIAKPDNDKVPAGPLGSVTNHKFGDAFCHTHVSHANTN